MSLMGKFLTMAALESEREDSLQRVLKLKEEALEWYKNLDVNSKIALKEDFHAVCGIPYTTMVCVCGMGTSIAVFYQKVMILIKEMEEWLD